MNVKRLIQINLATFFRPKIRPHFVIAYWPWNWFLRRQGFAAITMPWRSIYVLPHWLDHRQLRRHELVHIAQMRREGTIRFCCRYLWLCVTVGYWNNPYEIEARRIAGL